MNRPGLSVAATVETILLDDRTKMLNNEQRNGPLTRPEIMDAHGH